MTASSATRHRRRLDALRDTISAQHTLAQAATRLRRVATEACPTDDSSHARVDVALAQAIMHRADSLGSLADTLAAAAARLPVDESLTALVLAARSTSSGPTPTRQHRQDRFTSTETHR